jgi:hypothetical protein
MLDTLYILCKGAFGFLGMDLSDINNTMNRWQANELLKFSHHHCQVFPFWSFDLILQNHVDYIDKLSQNQMECRLANNKHFVTLEACYSRNKLVNRTCNTNWQVIGTISYVKLFSIKCFNFIINQPTNSLLTLKCSIHLKSLYCVVKKWKYQIVGLAFTHLLKS